MTRGTGFFQDVPKDQVLFSFNGVVTREWLDTFYQQLDNRFDNKISDARIKKRVNYILLESLQNLFHHARKNAGASDADLRTSCMVFRNNEMAICIACENVLLNSEIPGLREKIERINSMTPGELKSYYQEVLDNNTISSKGGAGLGLIEMARKSGNKLSYQFKKIDDRQSLFSLAVTVT